MKKPNPKRMLYQRISSTRELKKKLKVSHTRQIKQKMLKCHYSLPRVFSLKKEVERNRILNALKQIYSAEKRKNVYLDFSKVESLLPDATIHLVHTLQKFKHKSILGKPSKDRIVKAMLSRLEVHKQLKLPDFHLDKNESLVHNWYHYYGDTVDLPDSYDEFEKILDLHFNADDCFTINNAISEAVYNVVSHAYDEGNQYKGWLLFIHINNNSISIIISDLGKTIPRTVPTSFSEEKIWSYFKLDFANMGKVTDDKLIEYATQYQRTETELPHRGKGFADMQKICEQVKGSTMFVYSRNGYWCNDHTRKLYDEPVNGTIIGWHIPLKSNQINLK